MIVLLLRHLQGSTWLILWWRSVAWMGDEGMESVVWLEMEDLAAEQNAVA